MERTIYTREDCGCYADGALGFDHVSQTACDIAMDCGGEIGYHLFTPETDTETREEYEDYMTENVELALAYLNENCVEAGISFQFIDGDLLLIADDEADELQAREDRYLDGSGR